MADRNLYLAYKRDTRHLLYWLINASNKIIKSSSFASDSDAPPLSLNTTGQITVSALIPLSELIAKHISCPIPSTIYRLFESVIAARKSMHNLFLDIVSKTPDPEIERSNATHKRFIDALTSAFEALGGREWTAEKNSKTVANDEEDADEVIFANKFSTLNIDRSSDEGEEADAAEDGREASTKDAALNQPKKGHTGKGKKGKRGKSGKGKRNRNPAAKEGPPSEVPLESYRIIEDENGIITDYRMAVYALMKQWMELRDYLQDLWGRVAYKDLNSAVAGAVSNIANAMIKQTESAIFVDFPAHESYEAVMNTVTRGDRKAPQSLNYIRLLQLGPNKNVTGVVCQPVDFDGMEQFSIHTYTDLLDFITDFQKTRRGKPTKPMISQIGDVDPNLDLEKATKEQRIKWRRSYTINWLYDLVNVFSSIVIQRITMKGEKITLESVDWSVKGPWNVHRRLYGLNEFGGEVTSLAMQKPGTDIRPRILPHVVFQLQSIVDSLTVSRGWSNCALRGHVLSPPARKFRPRRDVDVYMDRENERVGHGFCQAVDSLVLLLEFDPMLQSRRHQQLSEIVKLFRDDLIEWLGESKYMYGLTTIPPSRFSNTNSNGLWEYSPFLCGVSLVEVLELSYSIGLMIWDEIPEPTCAIHLHNMLVQKGYIKQQVGLYASLQELFKSSLFPGGRVPSSKFIEAFQKVMSETGSRGATFQRTTLRRTALRTSGDLRRLINPEMNRFFKKKSLLQLCCDSDWIPDRISDDEVPIRSIIATMRMIQTKCVIDPETGKKVLENTTLINRAKALGYDDKTFRGFINFRTRSGFDPAIYKEVLASMPERYGTTYAEMKSEKALADAELLGNFKIDILGDICGDNEPLSSLNYIWVTVQFMLLFGRIEDALKSVRNPLWIKAYERGPKLMREKRASLTGLVLATEDEECLRLMAREFENPRIGFKDHIYWDDLVDSEKMSSMMKSDVLLVQ